MYYVIKDSTCYNNSPTVKHETKLAAEQEASRLARKHPGITFHVVMVIESVRCEVEIKESWEIKDNGRLSLLP